MDSKMGCLKNVEKNLIKTSCSRIIELATQKIHPGHLSYIMKEQKYQLRIFNTSKNVLRWEESNEYH